MIHDQGQGVQQVDLAALGVLHAASTLVELLLDVGEEGIRRSPRVEIRVRVVGAVIFVVVFFVISRSVFALGRR